SRLPLSSLEAPLPAFSLGEMAYFYRRGVLADALRQPALSQWQELVQHSLVQDLSWLEQAKLLETLLHAVPTEQIPSACTAFLDRWHTLGNGNADIVRLVHTLFNEASLSPYTDLVEKALAFVEELERQHHLSQETVADFLSSLLRLQGRHLTAYDLV